MNVLLSYYPSSTSQRVIRRKKTIDRDIQIAMQSPPQLAIEETREITTKEEEIRKTGSTRSLINFRATSISRLKNWRVEDDDRIEENRGSRFSVLEQSKRSEGLGMTVARLVGDWKQFHPICSLLLCFKAENIVAVSISATNMKNCLSEKNTNNTRKTMLIEYNHDEKTL